MKDRNNKGEDFEGKPVKDSRGKEITKRYQTYKESSHDESI